jgi:hypothetical protein
VPHKAEVASTLRNSIHHHHRSFTYNTTLQQSSSGKAGRNLQNPGKSHNVPDHLRHSPLRKIPHKSILTMADFTPAKANSRLLKRLELTTSQEVERKFLDQASKLTIKAGATRLTRASTASSQSLKMSSQRRAPRSGARGGAQENGEELNLWQDCTSVLAELQLKEKEAEDLKQKIFAEEAKLAESKRNGRGTLFPYFWLLQASHFTTHCTNIKKNLL